MLVSGTDAAGACYHPLNLALAGSGGHCRAIPEHVSEHMGSFPLFCAWIHELQADRPVEEAQRVIEKTLSAILTRRLSQAGFRDADEVLSCRNSVFMFMEGKLREPMEFSLDKVVCTASERRPVTVDGAKTIHLLRAEPFVITVRHPSIEPGEFNVRLQDMRTGDQITRVPNLFCDQERQVPIPLPYDAIGHEQTAIVELSREEAVSLAYYCGIRAVRHESFEVRMGFVVATARNLALEHARSLRKGSVGLTEDLDNIDLPASGQEARQYSYVALAKRTLMGLPPKLREQMIKHYIEGYSWTEIADEYQIAETKVKKDASRALTKIAESMVADEPEAAAGAVRRVVYWLKEMLPRILERN